MTTTDIDTTTDAAGPIDFLLLEFPGDQPLDEPAAELLALVDSGQVALYDLVAIRKHVDGAFSGIELSQVDPAFATFEGARSGLLDDDDLATAAAAMEPGTRAVLLVFENRWAAPFVGAALRAGGDVVASARIPATDVMAALDALDQR